MAEQPVTLSAFYKGWDVDQQHLVDAVTPLSPEQLALRASPDLRSIGAIATHIIGARARWLHFVLGEGGEELIALGTWDDDDQPMRSGAELASGLGATWQVIRDALERWTAADLDEALHDSDEMDLTRRSPVNGSSGICLSTICIMVARSHSPSACMVCRGSTCKGGS